MNQPKDEGQLVFEMIYGEGDRPRDTAPESALLPHLAASLCHDSSIEEVLDVAFYLGCQGGASPPWPSLYEASVFAAVARDELHHFLRHRSDFSAMALNIAQLHISPSGLDVAALFDEATGTPGALGPNFPDYAAAARLLPFQPVDTMEAWLSRPEFKPALLDAESVRALLVAWRRIDAPIPPAWLTSALDANPSGEYDWSRRAHLLPDLPESQRETTADELAADCDRPDHAPDFRALAVSRIAPFVSSRRVFRVRSLLAEMPEPWSAHIESLLEAPWPDALWDDVMRAHPEHKRFALVTRPHESTLNAASDIANHNDGAQAAMMPGSGSGTRSGPEEPSAPSPSPAAPSHGESPGSSRGPRALQANVLLDESMEPVRAFVANKDHVLEVSIGRGAAVRADVAFDETVFDETDSDWLKLPVWLTVGGDTQKKTLRVPRDRSADSRDVEFIVTAPAGGRVTARLFVMRPNGGLLLQKAMLIGDVVATADEASTHANGFTLTVDVPLGEPDGPDAASAGTVVADSSDGEGHVIQGDTMLDLDVSDMHAYLAKLVSQIELAADQSEFDDTAVGRKIVPLALAGQALRARFDAVLEPLRDKEVVQILSPRSGDVVPLELVYDGPALTPSSTLCDSWQDALRTGTCSNCSSSDEPDGPARICPLNFWAMKKVIERRTAQVPGGHSRVGAEPTAERPQLRPIFAATVGASGRVPVEEVDAVHEAVTQAFGNAQRVGDWAQWRDYIDDENPALLIAMPHDENAADGLTSALMMGEPTDGSDAPDATALLAGSVTQDEVRASAAGPGPIVFLLGCNTLFKEGQISSFVDEFRAHGAALTIATIGKLIAEHAPRAARVLVDCLANPPGDARSPGAVMLAARRRLLADGMIMALLLVANGDAQWHLPGDDQ